MSRCGKSHLLDAAVQGEIPDEALRDHAQTCPRCRHELNWLEAERRLFRERAARDEVQSLWKGVAQRTATEPRRRAFNRALVAVAATLFVVLGVGRVLLGAPASSSGLDASIISAEDFDDALVTENAFSPERAELCSRAQGIGFYCGYVPASVIASR